MGYHVNEIRKGAFGELSKIREELDEAVDAEGQGNRLMVLVELSDIIASIDGYLQRHYDGKVTVKDLVTMAAATKRAFADGSRR